MHHIPIVKCGVRLREIEFSHIVMDAPRGTWKKENLISLDHVKINIFKHGEFSIFVDDRLYSPIYGDVCAFSVHRIHSGNISKRTHTDYYQLDIGTDAFYGIPGGKELLDTLSKNSLSYGAFRRPNKAASANLIHLCERAESAIEDNATALAFACVVQIVAQMASLYSVGTEVDVTVLSKHVHCVINYIRDNFSEKIKIDELAKKCGVSASYLSRIFKREVGVTVHEYLTSYRVLKSTEMLKTSSVAKTGFAVGFSDSSHYISAFKKVMGKTPSAYKRR